MKINKHKISEYWKDSDKNFKFTVANESVFRLLGHLNFNFKEKNVLDIGIGNGDNLAEFRRRGSKIHGIDIRKKIIQDVCGYYNFPKKNFFNVDINNGFPIIKKKFDVILCKDLIYYLNNTGKLRCLKNCKKILNNDGVLIIQYIQSELKKTSNNKLEYDLKSNYIKQKNYHDKENPINFLKNSDILNLIKKVNLKIKKSFFEINTNLQEKNNVITVNRYLVLKK